MEMIRPTNWDQVNELDLTIWQRLTSNFWLDERIPLGSDSKDWGTLTESEQDTYMKVFAGLTLLDSIQSQVGAITMLPDALTDHEKSVYTYIAANESIHSKSYSSIFQSLTDTKHINEAFLWAETNENTQYKAKKILSFYEGNDPLKKKSASIMLESFLFYTGFFYTLYLTANRGILNNATNVIQLIMRDENLHGYYIGQKYQIMMDQMGLTVKEREEYKDGVYELLMDLYDNEEELVHNLYDNLPVSLSDEVIKFLKWNANKALMNLGYEALFSKEESTPTAEILSSMDSSGNSSHDFFSVVGSSYQIAQAEDTTDDDWEF